MKLFASLESCQGQDFRMKVVKCKYEGASKTYVGHPCTDPNAILFVSDIKEEDDNDNP
jgi:hypothetical protein